jgi:hypothetical protein
LVGMGHHRGGRGGPCPLGLDANEETEETEGIEPGFA